MNKETISDRQAITMIALFLMGTTLIIGAGGGAKRDVWIAIILGILAGLLIALVYIRLIFLFPDKDLIEILEEVFGKYIGKIIGFLYIWYVFHLGTLVLRNFGEFIDTVALPETPMIVSMIFIVFLSAWAAKEGIEVIGRLSEILFQVLLVIILLIQLLILPEIKLENIQPILYEGIGPVLKGSFSTFAFPFAELVIFIMFSTCLKRKSSSFKVYSLGIIVGGVIILVISLRNLLVLGANIVEIHYFPSYAAVTRINIANFLQRLEIAASLVFLVSVFIKLSVCILAASRGLSSALKLKDYRITIIPITLLMLNISYTIYENTMEMVSWASNVYPYYAFPFQVILPVTTLIGAEIKKRSQKT